MDNYFIKLKYIVGMVIICLHIQGTPGVVCGPNLERYNPSTHTCDNDRVLSKPKKPPRDPERDSDFRYTKCLDSATGELVLIDNFKQECKNATIVDQVKPTTTHEPVKAKAEPTTTHEPVQAIVKLTTSKPSAVNVELESGSSEHADWDQAGQACRTGAGSVPADFGCCGGRPYKPKDDTCCSQVSTRRAIHPVPEYSHVCCWNNSIAEYTVHKRGSKYIPCQHESTNDPLFTKVRHFNPLKVEIEYLKQICNSSKYVFHLDITGPAEYNFDLSANLTGWELLLKNKKNYIKPHGSPFSSVFVRKDKYTPSRRVFRKYSLMIFTDDDYSLDAVFYLNPIDRVFKFPKNTKRFYKTMKKLNKKCRRMSRTKLSKSRASRKNRHKRITYK
ncbi:hypothetical protein ACF0H5_007438 [Mactra antiquata]